VEAIQQHKIQCRVYRQDKFHAKCYLTHARQEVVGSFGLVGSSSPFAPKAESEARFPIPTYGVCVSRNTPVFKSRLSERPSGTRSCRRPLTTFSFQRISRASASISWPSR
jgi:hypothetical protein